MTFTEFMKIVTLRLFNMEFLEFVNLHGTHAIQLLDRERNIVNNYFVQFSFQDPWKYPHREERFDNGSYLYGWIFFYYGNIRAVGDTD